MRSVRSWMPVAAVVVLGCGSDGDDLPARDTINCPLRGEEMDGFRIAADTGLDGPVTSVATRGAPVAVGEIDGDGLPDIVLGDRRGHLYAYRNLGNLQFEPFPEVEEDVSNGVTALAMADLDGDGAQEVMAVVYRDVLIYTTSAQGLSLIDRFEVGASAMILPIDLDADGRLDLVFANLDMVAQERSGNALFLQQANGSFEPSPQDFTAGFSWTVTAWDYDRDGDLDLYVANDTFAEDDGTTVSGGLDVPVDQFLRHEQGGEAISLIDITTELGLETPRSSMGGLLLDLHGEVALMVPDYGANKVFVFDEQGAHDVAGELGLSSPLRETERCKEAPYPECMLPTWGVAQEDFDLDGRLEIVAGNSLAADGSTPPPLLWYEDDGEGGFQELSPSIGCLEAHALVPADFDGDGDQDLLVGPRDGTLTLLKNRTKKRGFTVRLGSHSGAREGRGAVVRANYDDGRSMTRFIGAGGVVFSSRPAETMVPADGLAELVVQWPGGEEQVETRSPDWGERGLVVIEERQ